MDPASQGTQQIQFLLDEAAAGHTDAYDRLIEQAMDRVYALARRMLRGYPRLRRWEETDDVFQTAVVRLQRSLGSVNPTSAADFMGLAATQIRRTLLDMARSHFGPEGKHARHHSKAGAADDDDPVGNAGQPTAVPDAPETLEQWRAFHEGVEKLPNEERAVFELVWYGDLAQQQVADLLDVSVRTVKRRMRAARVQLAEVLEE